MSGEIVAVRPDEPLQRAAEIMARHQVRRLPVTDEQGALVGVLSLNDLAGASADPRSDGITEHGVAQTLRAVCAPRALSATLGRQAPSEA
jgi:CBS domain-containing protein